MTPTAEEQRPERRSPADAGPATHRAARIVVLGLVMCGAWQFALPRAWAAVARAITPDAPVHVAETTQIEEGRYLTFHLPMAADGEVEVDLRVSAGPAVDVRFMDIAAFGEWKRGGSLRAGAPGTLAGLSAENTRRFRSHTSVGAGTYVLVVDNVRRGASDPRVRSRGGVTSVDCKIRTL